MKTALTRIEFPELFYGIVAPIGVDLSETVKEISIYLEAAGYRVCVIKVTDAYRLFAPKFRPWEVLADFPHLERLDTFIKYGNQLRDTFKDGAILAAASIFQINDRRREIIEGHRNLEQSYNHDKTAFIVHQFKRQEEVELFRSIYGKSFTQVSVYSRRENRVELLSRRFASDAGSSEFEKFRSEAESFVTRDQNERGHLEEPGFFARRDRSEVVTTLGGGFEVVSLGLVPLEHRLGTG